MLKGSMFKPGSRSSAKITLEPSAYTGVPGKANLIILTDIKNEAVVINLNREMVIGREVPGKTPDIPVNSPIVSRNHGVFSVDATGFYYKDNDSFNGTFINGVLYKQDVNPCEYPIRLKDGDIIRIDNRDAMNSHENAVTIIFTTSYDKRSKWRNVKAKAPVVPLGVSDKNLIEFDPAKIVAKNFDVAVYAKECRVSGSSRMAQLFYNNMISGSGVRVKNKDVFRVNNNYVYFQNGEFLYNVCLVTEPGLDINLYETTVPDKMGKKVLLKDIQLNIDKGDFALIIGGSGAGKSTFMNSILGKYDIRGTISIGGRPATGGGELTSSIAYVPQTLPIRKEERLIDVVTDTCILRCKRKMNNAQRQQFILDTLDSVGLKGKANMEIKKLSGGEQRRAAIANEVVTDSNIFFLDEPDSGLDPKSGMELMNQLKSLSDTGKMVMLISHNYASYPGPEKIYTKVIILAKSNKDGIGRLAYCGPVKEALEFFGVEALKDITKLINPVSENGEGRADEFVEKYRRLYGHG